MKRKRLLSVLLASLILITANAQTPSPLSIATGGVGGVYYPIGMGLAEMIDRHIEGFTAVAEVTGASVENMNLVARREADLALALADTVVQAYSGSGAFSAQPEADLRALGSVYPNALQIVTLAGSDIHSLQDLVGRRVSVGAEGSGTEVSARTVLAANGIQFSDLGAAERLSFTETAEALKTGAIDAGFWSVGPPTSSISDLARERAIRLIGLSEREIENAVAADATLAPHRVIARTYAGMEEGVPTVGTPNVLVVHQAMPEDLAYGITRMMFERVRELRNIHSVANNTTPTFSVGATPIPIHPGAARYYEELGFTLQNHQRIAGTVERIPSWQCRVVTRIANWLGCDCL